MVGRPRPCHGSDFCVALVEFVVEEDVFVPCGVVDDPLVNVLNAWIGGDGDDVCDVADFVYHVVDGECVFVVCRGRGSASLGRGRGGTSWTKPSPAAQSGEAGFGDSVLLRKDSLTITRHG